jgi:hypothetical protein
MTHTQAPKVKSIFNENITPNPDAQKAVTSELMRTLFFVRIAQISVSKLGKSEVISNELKTTLHNTAVTMRQLDMLSRNRISEKDKLWLTAELGKAKLMDIERLVEMMAKISSIGTEGDYEALMSMITTLLTTMFQLQSEGKQLNLNKFKALITFMAEEMKAEAKNGQVAVYYDVKSGDISFRLVQPNSMIPAKPVFT